MKTTEDLTLHLRLIAGDPTATLDCVERWLPWLERRLSQSQPSFASRDPHMLTTAAIDALLNYTGNPDSYDPARSSLGSYLFMSARGDLLNAMRRDRSHSTRAAPIESVELWLPDRNNNLEENAINTVDASAIWEDVLAAMPDPLDRHMLLLMMEGERTTKAYAAVLGIQDLPETQQRAIVKRHKDRISKRLERLGEHTNG